MFSKILLEKYDWAWQPHLNMIFPQSEAIGCLYKYTLNIPSIQETVQRWGYQ